MLSLPCVYIIYIGSSCVPNVWPRLPPSSLENHNLAGTLRGTLPMCCMCASKSKLQQVPFNWSIPKSIYSTRPDTKLMTTNTLAIALSPCCYCYCSCCCCFYYYCCCYYYYCYYYCCCCCCCCCCSSCRCCCSCCCFRCKSEQLIRPRSTPQA